ncbi:hypothetical protein HPB50_010134 [Hyalomma asiaticum]|uniref:Uncharacterized protein n=1 Tax=Hyalomma asiaticum TaxID=266040 RepID=A0ACB7TFY8_HYAAI|nr:hypothetical protein HPB50_010134 [Hyalomma asiaticum]
MTDPEKQGEAIHIHWLAFNVTNDTERRAFSEFGEVMGIFSDKEKATGFEPAYSTSRVIRLLLRDCVSPGRMPHRMRFSGGTVLVVVPGHAPICLRSHTTGKISRECRVPCCTECRAFGHEQMDSPSLFQNI